MTCGVIDTGAGGGGGGGAAGGGGGGAGGGASIISLEQAPSMRMSERLASFALLVSLDILFYSMTRNGHAVTMRSSIIGF
jgi:hypothetical protein